jgi:hypothetical protein
MIEMPSDSRIVSGIIPNGFNSRANFAAGPLMFCIEVFLPTRSPWLIPIAVDQLAEQIFRRNAVRASFLENFTDCRQKFDPGILWP